MRILNSRHSIQPGVPPQSVTARRAYQQSLVAISRDAHDHPIETRIADTLAALVSRPLNLAGAGAADMKG